MSLYIRKVSDVRFNCDLRQWEIYCQGEGLEDIEASWERFKSIATDAPTVAKNFVKEVEDPEVKEGLMKELKELS